MSDVIHKMLYLWSLQGRAHIDLIPRVRSMDEIRVSSLRIQDAQDAAGLDPRACAVESYEAAIRGAGRRLVAAELVYRAAQDNGTRTRLYA